MQSKNNLKILSYIYLVGIVIGVALGLIIINKNLSSNYLLIEGLFHVLILTMFGYTMKEPFKQVIAGSKIETAGYLHTVIGFFVAIALVGKGDINMDNLLSPISSALLTSIIGWLFGGEISGRGEEHQQQTTDEIVKIFAQSSYEIELMLENTKTNLQYLFTQLTEIQNEYHKKTIKSAEQYQTDLGRTLGKIDILINTKCTEVSSSFNNLVYVIEQGGNNLESSLSTVTTTIQTNNNSWQYTFNQFNNSLVTQTNKINGNFNNLRKTLTDNSSSINSSFQQTNSLIVNNNKTLANNLLQTNLVITNNNQTLTNNLGQTNDIITTNFNSLQGINQNLTNLHNEINNTASLMKQASSHCQNLSTFADDTANYLATTKVLMQQAEAFTQYIVSQRR